jgi:hypothetical protein
MHIGLRITTQKSRSPVFLAHSLCVAQSKHWQMSMVDTSHSSNFFSGMASRSALLLTLLLILPPSIIA